MGSATPKETTQTAEAVVFNENSVISFHPVDQAILAYQEELAKVQEVTDKKTRDLANSFVYKGKKITAELERNRKELKKGALEYGRKVDAVAKEFKEKVSGINSGVLEAVKKYDQIEADRLEAERKKEEERQAAIDFHFENLRHFEESIKFGNIDIDFLESEIKRFRAKNDEDTQERAEEYQLFKEGVLSRAETLLKTEKKRAEELAEIEKARKEQEAREAELKRKEEEQAAELKRQQEEIEEQKRELEKQKAAAEAEEAKKREEAARKEQEEAEAKAEEERLKREAAEAELEEVKAQAEAAVERADLGSIRHTRIDYPEEEDLLEGHGPAETHTQKLERWIKYLDALLDRGNDFISKDLEEIRAHLERELNNG